MKIASTIAYLSAALVAFANAQQVRTNTLKSTPPFHPKPVPPRDAPPKAPRLCSTPTGAGPTTSADPPSATLATFGIPLCVLTQPRALPTAPYGTYGITTSGNQVSLKLVTVGPYSTNVGSRIYLLEDDNNYKLYKLLNQEFTFDVDVSQLPCGLNGALYFVQMDKDGGKSKYPTNKAGAAYGTGYCDAQCPHDIKFINGEANVNSWVPSTTDPNAGTGAYGSCCTEMDIWESNTISQAYTSHPCTVTSQTRCSSATQCGDDATGNRFDGVCDKDGCDFNPYRYNNHNFYGPGSSFAVDSIKPLTVVTQFITDDNTANGNLVQIKRYYVQNGVAIDSPNINWSGIDPLNYLTDTVCNEAKTLFGDNNQHKAKGGLTALGNALKNGVVLTISLWTDHAAKSLWLDSTYPTNKSATIPGVGRGTCSITSGVPSEVQSQYPSATVKHSNIRIGDLGTTTGGVKPPTTSAPTTAPTTSTSAPTTTKTTPAPTTSTSAPTTAPTTTKATPAPTTSTSAPTTSKATPAPTTSTAAPTTTASSAGSVGAYGQCGGGSYTGPTTCVAGYTSTTIRNGTRNASPTKWPKIHESIAYVHPMNFFCRNCLNGNFGSHGRAESLHNIWEKR
ncbi:unnamed protein product [Aphanomyces euteiches]